jgi:hypothetical protein
MLKSVLKALSVPGGGSSSGRKGSVAEGDGAGVGEAGKGEALLAAVQALRMKTLRQSHTIQRIAILLGVGRLAAQTNRPAAYNKSYCCDYYNTKTPCGETLFRSRA